MFGNMTNDGLEKSGDVLGGGGVVDTAVYPAKIKMAYKIVSKGGATGIVTQFELPDGKQYSETLYVTNKQGDIFYTKNDKKYPLPGFTTVNDIALMATGFPLSEQNVEEKVVKVYNYESKAEIPTKVPVLVDLLGKDVKLAIQRNLEDKTALNESTQQYEPTGETRDTNNIDKVFHAESNKTVTEIVEKKDAEFLGKWAEKNDGKVRNKVKGGEGKSGAPTRSNPTSGGTTGKPKSLFG